MTAQPEATRHTPLEDVLALLVGSLFVALSVAFFRHAGLLTGGTTGLAFIAHYALHWPLGWVLFVVNLPFYIFALRAMGLVFTLKTFGAVLALSVLTEWMPHLLTLQNVQPMYAAVIAGLLAGTGILILIRHGASLGGIGVMAVYLQNTRGWRAGAVQMGCDLAILLIGLAIMPWDKLLLSVLSAAAMNQVIALNHRPDRYFGF